MICFVYINPTLNSIDSIQFCFLFFVFDWMISMTLICYIFLSSSNCDIFFFQLFLFARICLIIWFFPILEITTATENNNKNHSSLVHTLFFHSLSCQRTLTTEKSMWNRRERKSTRFIQLVNDWFVKLKNKQCEYACNNTMNTKCAM